MSQSTSAPASTSYIMQSHGTTFGTYSIADEELHPEDQNRKPDQSLTETHYFGFFVPEENIHCFTWIWCHPNLRTVTGGTMAWRGIKSRSLACELFDYRNFMDIAVLGGSYTTFELDMGLKISMEEPGKRFRLSYDDPTRGNKFEVVQTAVSEPLVWPTSNHFEQVMKCSGSMTLRGDSYDVNCFSVRDRSFGEYRSEQSASMMPPVYWITGVFDERFSFCIVGTDHPQTEPFWKDRFGAPESTLLRFGWMIVDGEKTAVESSVIGTKYDRSNLSVSRMNLKITDVRGREFEIEGEVGAAVPFEAWMNARVPVALTHWKCGERVGVGEIQAVQYTDFLQAYSQPG